MTEKNNTTLRVEFTVSAPTRTVFGDGESHVELTGVVVGDPNHEWHRIRISEDTWELIAPHVHVGDKVEFTGTVMIPEPDDRHYYEHHMASGHVYDVGDMRDGVATGFIAAAAIPAGLPWSSAERKLIKPWDELPVRSIVTQTKKPIKV